MITLLLDGNMLTGHMPPAWAMPYLALQLVSCQNNKLSGLLPANWGCDPKALTSLQYLLMHNNSLSGSLPVEWSTTGKHVMLCCHNSVRQQLHFL